MPDDCLGIFDGMPQETYRAHPAISKSDLDRIAGRGPPPDSSALEFGSFVHCLVLEPDRVSDCYFRAPAGIRKDKRTCAWQEVLQNANGRIIIDEDDWDTGLRMRDAVFAHETASRLLQGGIAERSVFAKDLDGLALKVRPDYTVEECRAMVDLKTAQTASPREFGETAAKYRYHCQAYYYRHVYNLALGYEAVRDFLWIVVEKTAPFHVFVIDLPERAIDLGRREIARDLITYQQRHLIHPADLPAWYYRRTEEMLYGY